MTLYLFGCQPISLVLFPSTSLSLLKPYQDLGRTPWIRLPNPQFRKSNQAWLEKMEVAIQAEFRHPRSWSYSAIYSLTV
jgi:hypothetical protein